jgi:hypothetical protein
VSGVQAGTARIPQGGAVRLLLAGRLYLLPFLLPYNQLSILSFRAELLSDEIWIADMLAALGARG